MVSDVDAPTVPIEPPRRALRNAFGSTETPRAAFLPSPRPSSYSQEELDAAYTRGFLAGNEEGQTELRRSIDAITTNLDAARRAVVDEMHRVDTARREELVRLAFDVARWLLQEELHADPAIVLARVKAALPERHEELIVKVAPALVPVVAPALSNIPVVPDAALALGDVVIIGPDGQIDGTIDDALDRLARYLHAEDDGSVR